MQKTRDWNRFIPRNRPHPMRPFQFLVAGLTMALLTACASSTMAPNDAGMTHDTSIGRVLVDSKGMTLYTYDKDEPSLSHCYGLCAVFWPPVKAGEGVAGKDGFTVISREDGSQQWAYQDKPLYTYLSDERPGDVGGDGVDGVWHVARL